MSEDRWRGGARPWPSNYTGGWHKDVSAAKKRIPQCPGVCCVCYLAISTYSRVPHLLSVAGPVSCPRSGRHRQMSRGGREKLCLPPALPALCHELDDLLQAPQCPRGQAHLYTTLTTDSWCWHAPALRGSLTTKDSRACWHQRLGLERNYKELIPSRPFSSPTPTVPGLGAHIMLTLSQFWPVVFPGAGSWCAHPSSPLLTRPKN